MAQRKVGPGESFIDREVEVRTDQQREEIERRFWQAVEGIRECNVHRDPDEILREVTDIVEEVRQEQYDRARNDQGGR